MSQRSFVRPAVSAMILVVLFALGLVWFAVVRNRQHAPDDSADNDRPGFREGAEEAGIDFRMAFLPGEQGERFKINLYDHGCGVAVADFNKDDHDDVYFVNQLGPNKLYRNNKDGTFEDVTAKAGVGLGDRVCVAAAWGDYDNDGYPDLFVTSTRGGNVLFHNVPDPKDPTGKKRIFVDVTKEAGLEQKVKTHSQTATWFDYDNDGHLDLFVTNTAQWTLNDYDKASHYFKGP